MHQSRSSSNGSPHEKDPLENPAVTRNNKSEGKHQPFKKLLFDDKPQVNEKQHLVKQYSQMKVDLFTAGNKHLSSLFKYTNQILEEQRQQEFNRGAR